MSTVQPTLTFCALVLMSGCFLAHGRGGGSGSDSDAGLPDAAGLDASLDAARLDAPVEERCAPVTPELFGACPLDVVWWWWDGSDCVTDMRGSCCDGPDCARTFTSRTACYDAYRSCGASPPTGTHWVFERRETTVRVAECGETMHAMDTGHVEVDIGIYDTCERAGPVELVEQPDGSVRVVGRVWRQVTESGDLPDGCEYVTDNETRNVAVPFAELSDLRVVSEGGEVVIAGHGIALDCSAETPDGEHCNGDCECVAGLRCLPALRDRACHGFRCGDPCELVGAACDEERACSQVADRSVPVCVDEVPACLPGEGCALPPSVGAHLEYGCTSDDDCGGAICAVRNDGARECVAPCFSRTTRCPARMACLGSPPEDGLWSCQPDR